MKIRFTLVFFNSVVIIFLGCVFLFPLFVLGRDAAGLFWRSLWFYLPPLFLLLAGVDIYFALNFKVFVLLEKEDWPALVRELETRVLHKGNYSRRLIKLLANSYFVLSDTRSITVLEEQLAEVRPKLVNTNALVFGAARVFSGDTAGTAAFFKERLESGKVPAGGREWLSWYYGFALLLNRQFEPASERFSCFTRESKNGVLAGLSAYFLENNLDKNLPGHGLVQTAREGKERIRRVLKRRIDWDREVKRFEMDLHAAVLTVYIKKTAAYIYGDNT